MSNNRLIFPLIDLAFNALLKYRREITPNSAAEYEVLMQQKLKTESPHFLQAIAEGNQSEVEEFLIDNPQLAVMASGTIVTPSGDTIENVTAVQLAYLVEDNDIADVLLTALNKLSHADRVIADRQLSKIAEVDAHSSTIQKFNFTDLVNAISNDQTLKDTGKASIETEKAFLEFKEYFKPKIVTTGRPFNIQNLQEAYQIYDKNWQSWRVKQLVWFLHNIIRLLLGRVSASYAQAFSQGLRVKAQPLTRSFTLRNYYDNEDLSYYAACNMMSAPDDFFIDIYSGCASASRARGRIGCLGDLIYTLSQTKTLSLQAFKQQLQQPQDQCSLCYS